MILFKILLALFHFFSNTVQMIISLRPYSWRLSSFSLCLMA